jgi:mono/diheme cytochrome c family protein
VKKSTGLILFGLSLVVVVPLAQNCGPFSPVAQIASSLEQGASNGNAELQAKAVNILENKCIACHGAVPLGGPTNITDVNAMIMARVIVPGNPNQSTMFTQIESGVMPQVGSLTNDEINTIHDWIVSLAAQEPAATPTPAPGPGATATPTPGPGATPTPAKATPTPTPTPPKATPTPTPTPSSLPTFMRVNSEIIQPKCAICHSAFVTFSGVKSYTQPGNPENSPIYIKVNSGEMPKNGSKLSAAEIKLIYDWIKAGSQNN